MKFVRIMAVLLAACMLVCLAGCDGANGDVSPADVVSPDDVSATEEEPAIEDEPEDVSAAEPEEEEEAEEENPPEIISYEIAGDGWVYYLLGDDGKGESIWKVFIGGDKDKDKDEDEDEDKDEDGGKPERVVEFKAGKTFCASFAVEDGWVYYHTYDNKYNTELRRVDADGNDELLCPTEEQEASEVFCEGVARFTIADGWIYMIDTAVSNKRANDLYKMKADGTGLTSIYTTPDNSAIFDEPYVAGGRVFAKTLVPGYFGNSYINHDLISFNTKGKQMKTVRQFRDGAEALGITFDGGSIYYCCRTPGKNPFIENFADYMLCRMALDGTKHEEVCETTGVFCVSKGVVYYGDVSYDGESKFLSYDPKDDTPEKISGESITEVKASGEWLYYKVEGQDGVLWRMTLDGADVLQVV